MLRFVSTTERIVGAPYLAGWECARCIQHQAPTDVELVKFDAYVIHHVEQPLAADNDEQVPRVTLPGAGPPDRPA